VRSGTEGDITFKHEVHLRATGQRIQYI
jgi:hypothetical protein